MKLSFPKAKVVPEADTTPDLDTLDLAGIEALQSSLTDRLTEVIRAGRSSDIAEILFQRDVLELLHVGRLASLIQSPLFGFRQGYLIQQLETAAQLRAAEARRFQEATRKVQFASPGRDAVTGREATAPYDPHYDELSGALDLFKWRFKTLESQRESALAAAENAITHAAGRRLDLATEALQEALRWHQAGLALWQEVLQVLESEHIRIPDALR